MSDSTPPDDDVQETLRLLHQLVVAALTRVSDLFDRSVALGISSGTAEAQARDRRDLHGQLESVIRLELVMPIVAPMKAGKSTLISGIVGYPLMPARADAMTTMPTRVKLVDGLAPEQTRLVLPVRTVTFFNTLEGRIQQRMRAPGWSLGEEAPHLADLVGRLRAGGVEPLRSEYTGVEECRDVLKRLNDALRLAVIVGLDKAMDDLEDLPELWAGRYGGVDGTGGPGDLVLVDTAGPNEYRLRTQLGDKLDAVLRTSHVVLIVLDYTQMGSEADEKVRAMVQAQVQIIGAEKILVVVNKVDQRMPNDPNYPDSDQTRARVTSWLGLSAAQAEGRIFETAAKWGLAAAQMLAELDAQGERFVPAESAVARDFMYEYQPTRNWERVRQRLTAADLREYAEEMYDQSGLAPLIASAIARLRANAAPVATESGVRRFHDLLVRLGQVAALEISTESASQADVAAQVANLDASLADLQRHWASVPSTDALEKQFADELSRFTGLLKEQGHDLIAVVEGGDGQQVTAPTDPYFDALLARVGDAMTSFLAGRAKDDVQEFSQESGARDYAERMTDVVAAHLADLLSHARNLVADRAAAFSATLVGDQERAVRAVITRSAGALSTAFDLDLELPPPVVQDGRIVVDLPQPTVRESYSTTIWTTEVTRTYGEVAKNIAGHLFGSRSVNRPYSRTVTEEHSSISTEYHYQVSRKRIADDLRTAFDARLDEIEGSLNGYVATEVHDKLVGYYTHVTTYLADLRAALDRALDNKRQSEAEQKQRAADLRLLAVQITDERGELVGYLNQLAGLGSIGPEAAE